MPYLPDANLGPLRIGSTPETLSVLLSEPLLFAAHYAIVAELIDLPEALETRLEGVRTRYRAHDAALELIDTLRGQVPMALSIDLAQHLAEGLELHTALTESADITAYREACAAEQERHAHMRRTLDQCDETSAYGRLMSLSGLLGLSAAETTVLSYALAHPLMPALALFTRLFGDQRGARSLFWQTLLDLPAEDLTRALSAHSRLAGSGLLRGKGGIPTLSEFWVELIVRTGSPLDESVLAPMGSKDSPGGAGRLPDEDKGILETLLNRRDPGINVLLYGKPSVDKARLAKRLIDVVGAEAVSLHPDIPDGELPAAVMIAQRLLERRAGRHILVVDKVQAVLTRVLPEAFSFFGLGDEDDSVRPLDERILTENPVPTLWLTHEAKRIHRETLTRFLFHAEVLKGTRADRQALVESLIEALPLQPAHKAELVKLEGLSAPQLTSAQTLAKLTAGRSRKTFARHLLVAATRSQKALARRSKDEARIPVTRYSLDYIHSAGRFGPGQILKAFAQRPQGSVCLYGLPGTGKTQFAEHLALELGKPLLVKHASELLDKYVGESEKRMAEAFDQAEEEGAILLLDEADSFLRDRTLSKNSWEVTLVNELLQRMERFEDIFIATTNLYNQLDIAALRRFTFKLEFLPLTLTQRWAMFLNETGVQEANLSEAAQMHYEERLALMRDLTPGDFATVKRQCVLLGDTLSPEDWLSQLELEVAAKHREPRTEGVAA